MTRLRLILRSLWYFRAVNASAAAALSVAVAALVGALIIGDSVRGSLRAMALARLGPVDYALVAGRFFDADLAGRIASQPGFGQRFASCTSAIIVRGAIRRESDRATTAAQILSADALVTLPRGSCAISQAVADALGVRAAGETILITVGGTDDAESITARRSREEALSGFRGRVDRIVPDGQFESSFDLHPSQRPQRNVWMNMGDLQEAVGQENRANAILISEMVRTANPTEALDGGLRLAFELRDAGLRMDGVLTADSTYIDPAVDRAAEAAGAELGVALQRITVHLAQRIERAGGTKNHYAVIGAVSDLALRDDQVAVNQWTADQLGARENDELLLSLYERRADGTVGIGQPARFHVARILPMTGLGADPTLTPVYKGLTDTDSIANWKPPAGMEIKQDLVTDEDEKYWEKYRAAPKVFVSLKTAERLWGGPSGYLTSIRVPANQAKRFAEALRQRLDPGDLGLRFQPVRAQQLAAAAGNTPFEGLFLGFSMFLIASALLLTIMLLRLGVAQRSRQLGLLAAIGFDARSRRRIMLAEGAILCVVAAAAGALLAVGYAWVMLAGLRTWWVDAVGTTGLGLHLNAGTMAMGLAIGFVVAMITIALAVWRLGRVAPARLLAGSAGDEEWRPRTNRFATIVALVALLCGVAAIAAGSRELVRPATAFMAGGMFLLTAALAAVRAGLRSSGRSRATSLLHLAWRNTTCNAGRSTLAVGLMALASFILITVGSMRKTGVSEPGRSGGTGGFQIIVQTDIPLPASPDTKAGRDLLGIRDINNPLWTRCRFLPLRASVGQDASCLNLVRPDSPTIVAASPEMRRLRPFHFARLAKGVEDPWALLDSRSTGSPPVGFAVRTNDGAHSPPYADFPASTGLIPVIADDETAQYILKVSPGDQWTIPAGDGRPVTVRLVATIESSIFQGELLMAEENFRALFPGGGFRMMLIETPAAGDIYPLSRLLAAELSDYAPTIQPTAARLARYQQVANTYLATFQMLGGLGLLLGTIGLAAALLRGVYERRNQFALLAAVGFSSAFRQRLIWAENALLLVLGLGIGTICALIAAVPAWTNGRAINWVQLSIALVVILAVGILSLAVAARIGGRQINPSLLRAE